MRVFGIDPGCERTGYGCIETDGNRHHLIACGALRFPARTPFVERLRLIHVGLADQIGRLTAPFGLGAGGWLMDQRWLEVWLTLNVIVAFLHYAYDGVIWRRRAAA